LSSPETQRVPDVEVIRKSYREREINLKEKKKWIE
jgi:hypothetical protein